MLNTIIKEIKELCVDKKIWIGILTVLIIMIIGTSYNRKNPENKAGEPLAMGVINHDNSTNSKLLLSYFDSSKTFTSFVRVVRGDSKTIEEAFEKGELDIYLEIPENFTQDMIRMEHTPIKVTINIEDTTKALLFQNVLKSYEKYISSVETSAVGLYEVMEQDHMEQELITSTNRKVSIDLIFTALGKEAFFSYQELEQFPATTVILYYISAGLILAIFYFSLYIGYRILNEMKQGTFTRIQTTKTSLFCYLTGKLSVYILLIASITFAAISIISRGQISGGCVWFSLTAAMYVVNQAVFLCVLFRTTQSFVLVGNLILFYFAILGGGIIPIQYLPQDMFTLARFTPNYYLQRGIIEITNGMYEKVHSITAGFLLVSFVMYGSTLLLLRRRRGLL